VKILHSRGVDKELGVMAMSDFPSYRVTVTRPVQTPGGTEVEVHYRTVAREVACELYSEETQGVKSLPGTRPLRYAQAIISPRADVRFGDRLVEPTGQCWVVDHLVRSDLVCRCTLREG